MVGSLSGRAESGKGLGRRFLPGWGGGAVCHLAEVLALAERALSILFREEEAPLLQLPESLRRLPERWAQLSLKPARRGG